MSDMPEQSSESLRRTLVTGSDEYFDSATMLNRSVGGSNSLRRTLVAGSEEDFDVICDLCNTEGYRVEATGYCVDCREHLCNECKRYHKKTTATKHHDLKDQVTIPRSAVYLQDLHVKWITDKKGCRISGAVVLPDGRLAVADFSNDSIKLMDTDGTKPPETLKLMFKPGDITIVKDDQLAVVYRTINCVQFLSLSPKLSLSHMLEMPCCYSGIAYKEAQLILSCYKPGDAVHICDLSGNVLKQVDRDDNGNKLFDAPSRITVNQFQSAIYVTDFERNKLVCLNTEGKVIATYVNEKLQNPVGIAVDDKGFVYVCSRKNHTIHQLSQNGTFIRVILEEKDGISLPCAITYRAGKLYISSSSADTAHHNNIKVYRLE